MDDFEAKERQRLTRALSDLLLRVPPSVNKGSYDYSVKFKSDVVRMKKLMAKRGVSNSELRGAISTMQRYWEAT
jgi:hypothetical protein